MYGGGGGMGGGGGGMWRRMNATDEKPEITWKLLKRVFTYARPYRWKIGAMLVMLIAASGLALVSPLIMRNLIDEAIPNHDMNRLVVLALALLIVPAIGSVISIGQRYLNSSVGEGVVYDLRTSLYAHFQDMSLRFFTNSKVGELMSRLNNDVVGA